MSDFLFIPLRPFFYAALAKRWKVQFRKSLRKFNNVDKKKKRHILMRTAVLCYIYRYICMYLTYVEKKLQLFSKIIAVYKIKMFINGKMSPLQNSDPNSNRSAILILF